MTRLILIAAFLSISSFGVTAGKVWSVSPGKSLGSWNYLNTLPLGVGSSPFLTNYSGNTLGVVNSTSRPAVVSAGAPASGLLVVRGYVTSCGSVAGGEGFTSSGVVLSACTMNFSVAFDDTPVCVCMGTAGGNPCSAASTSSSAVQINATGSTAISFICTGLRPSGS